METTNTRRRNTQINRVGQALPDNAPAKGHLPNCSISYLAEKDASQQQQTTGYSYRNIVRQCLSDNGSPLTCPIGHPLPPGARKMTHGFTLIELLIVVLIIGILAAVAVPQYQKAVLKSRFAIIKDLTRSLAQAEEIYYLANNEYTIDFETLDITTPPSEDEETHDTWSQRKWDWGKCNLVKSSMYVSCQFKVNGIYIMAYQIYLNHTSNPQTWCVAQSDDLNAPANKICQSETGKAGPYEEASGTGYKVWVY